MGELSASLLAALKAPNRALWMLSVSLPGGTQLWSMVPYASTGSGMCVPRILSLSQIGRALSSEAGSIEEPEIEVEIDDSDDAFAAEAEGSSGNSVEGCAVSLRLVEPTLGASGSDHAIVFVGVIARGGVAKSGPHTWRIRMRASDAPLLGMVALEQITRSAWPQCSDSALNQHAPVIWGRHAAPAGAVPTLYVDTTGYRYLVGQGYYTVSRVLKDGALAAASGYAITRPIIKGVQYTCIDFTSDQGDSAEITCDVEGFDSVGDGTGDLIEDPVDAIEHFLENFVWGRWKSGAFLTGGAPLYSTSWTAVKGLLDDFGFRAARRLAEPRVAADILDEWSQTFQVRLYWRQGQLAAHFDDFRNATYTATHVRDIDLLEDMTFEDPEQDPIDSIRTTYQLEVYDSRQELSVRDEALGLGREESLDLLWLTSALG